MGGWPATLPVVVCAVVAAVVAAAPEFEAVSEEDDTAASAPAADLADLLEAQPVRTTPAAMSENTTEILIFVVRLFMVGIEK